MMKLALILVFCSMLCLIAYHDFRYRVIPLYLLILTLFCAIVYAIVSNSVGLVVQYVITNFIMVLLQFAGITLYFSLKNKKLTNILNDHFGSGDLFFYVVLLFCFSPLNFVLFNVIACFCLVLIFAFYRRKTLIPLAGCLAICLLFVIFFSQLNTLVQPFDDYFVAAYVFR